MSCRSVIKLEIIMSLHSFIGRLFSLPIYFLRGIRIFSFFVVYSVFVLIILAIVRYYDGKGIDGPKLYFQFIFLVVFTFLSTNKQKPFFTSLFNHFIHLFLNCLWNTLNLNIQESTNNNRYSFIFC